MMVSAYPSSTSLVCGRKDIPTGSRALRIYWRASVAACRSPSNGVGYSAGLMKLTSGWAGRSVELLALLRDATPV